MKIYVLVKVEYDYYRFQENFGAFTSEKDAELRAKKLRSSYDVYCYVGNGEKESELNNSEEPHWWIQSFDLIENK